MIIYGNNTKDLGTQKLQGTNCPNCEATAMHVNATVGYAHLFWIPVFPFSKKFFTVCGNCQQVLKKKAFSPKLKEKVAMEKHHFKTPIYLYSGLFLIALLLAYAFYTSLKDDELLQTNIQNLDTKDILVFKASKREYAFAEVKERVNDTVYMYYGNYTYEGRKPSMKVFESEKKTVSDFFSYDETYYFTVTQIDSLRNIDELVEIYTYD